MKAKGFTSRILKTLGSKTDPHAAFQVPIYANGAYGFSSAEDMERAFRGEIAAHAYSRSSNPTVENLELRMKAVTGAHGVLAVSSGLAAITCTIVALCNAGDNIITSHYLFGNTWSLFSSTLGSLGVEVRFANMLDGENVASLIDSKTRALFFETVTNPQIEVADVAMLSGIARRKNILLIGDTSMTPPNVFDAKKWGVNIEIVSSSKIISGGGTTIGGLVVDYASFDYGLIPKLRDFHARYGGNAFYAKLRKEVYRNLGSCMSPFNAYLQSLGLESLALRFDKSAENALRVASFLENHPAVKSVNYCGLKSSPFYSLSCKQFGEKPTSLISFNLTSKKACFDLLNALQFVSIATNLMDNRTLILHPASTIYVEYNDNQKASMNIPDTLIRLSVGIEDVEDIVDDFNQAFANIK